jgi:hypothetical protein
MMEAVRTSETSVDKHFTRQYKPEDSSEHHTRRRENLKSHTISFDFNEIRYGGHVIESDMDVVNCKPGLDPTWATRVV